MFVLLHDYEEKVDRLVNTKHIVYAKPAYVDRKPSDSHTAVFISFGNDIKVMVTPMSFKAFTNLIQTMRNTYEG